MSRTSDNGIIDGLGQVVMLWDPMTDQHFVAIEEVRKLVAERTFCYVHETPPVSDEEKAFIEAGDIDAICIQVVRVQ
jgi:hypothetical protein